MSHPIPIMLEDMTNNRTKQATSQEPNNARDWTVQIESMNTQET
jgi:hypothetical protein